MDKFIVSARKYRPQNFSTVIGQSHITTTLKNAINNNQLAHAFLFCGPRGVGKTTCARILAKTINCEKRTKEGEACNKCNSCISFDNSSSFNIHELDAASKNTVDDIRGLIDEVRIPPQSGNYKVYIIDEVHMLSSNAFNAFLKTLEEPPHYAIFILATTEKHKILPTILSRCQIFDFKRITINDTVEHLEEIIKKEKLSAEKTALHFIAQKSEGCLRDALSILDKITSFTGGKLTYANTLEHLNILDEHYYFTILEHMQEQQLTDALLLFDEINLKGFEGDTFLEGLADFIDVFCEQNYFSAEETDRILEAGVKHGLKPKVHVNQFNIIGGVGVSVKHHALSVDHLEHISDEDISQLKNSSTMPVALPGCSLFLKIPFTAARKIIDAGLPLALASDYNPGSAPSGNMNLVNSLACINMNMTPEEVMNASTINGAYAMNVEKELGAISIGKKASLIVTKAVSSLATLPYSFGSNLVERAIIQ